MSEITKNETLNESVTNEKKDLTLEQKVENFAIENKADDSASEAELDKVLKKKNELLNEKKKAQLQNKQLQDELANLRTAMARQEQEKLEQNQEYKTLWERTSDELKREREDRLNLEKNIVKSQKRKAFDRELGKSLSKDRYYDFVNFDDIIVEADGTVNSDSVRYAVNLFRENYRELVPQVNVPRVGSEAPSNAGVVKTRRNVNELTKEDRSNLKRRLLTKS